MEYIVDNSGLSVTAVFSDENIQDIFVPLLRHLTALQRTRQGRLLVLLAAPPASGKSTLAAFLKHLSQITPGVCPITVIPLDGFHRPQAWLESHTAERDGRSVSMASIKGAPATFDLARLQEAVARVASGEDCLWPVYDRRLHEPVPDAMRVTGKIVLLEGNYLLLDEAGWREVHGLGGYSIGIVADPGALCERLIARHLAGGKPLKEAVARADGSDMANIRRCLRHSLRADLTLRLEPDGSFTVV